MFQDIHKIDMSTMAVCPFCGHGGSYYINDMTTYHLSFHPDGVYYEADEYQYNVECAACSATCCGDPCESEQEAYDSAVANWNHRVR